MSTTQVRINDTIIDEIHSKLQTQNRTTSIRLLVEMFARNNNSVAFLRFQTWVKQEEIRREIFSIKSLNDMQRFEMYDAEFMTLENHYNDTKIKMELKERSEWN